jgi:outer membrane immunogenic protein
LRDCVVSRALAGESDRSVALSVSTFNTGRNADVLQIGDSTNLKTGRDLYAGSRLGFAISPTTMIYAKGGYTNAKFKARYANYKNLDVGTNDVDIDGERHQAVVGLGIRF